MTSRKLVEDFISQNNIAVVGVSRKKSKFGNYIYRELKKKDYRVFPINPKLEFADGDKQTELMEMGQKLQVYVLNVDQEKGRVALSTKRLQPDPWSLLDETYMVGELIEATITKLTNYGAFARVNDEYELEGLIHISELASERIEHPREIVERGDIVALRIIKLDSTQRQMGLSIKQVTSDEYLESDLALAETMESE